MAPFLFWRIGSSKPPSRPRATTIRERRRCRHTPPRPVTALRSRRFFFSARANPCLPPPSPRLGRHPPSFPKRTNECPRGYVCAPGDSRLPDARALSLRISSLLRLLRSHARRRSPPVRRSVQCGPRPDTENASLALRLRTAISRRQGVAAGAFRAGRRP